MAGINIYLSEKDLMSLRAFGECAFNSPATLGTEHTPEYKQAEKTFGKIMTAYYKVEERKKSK